MTDSARPSEGTASQVSAADHGPMDPEIEALLREDDEISEKQRGLLDRRSQIWARLMPLGLREHDHGSGTREDPTRWHAHAYDDPDHPASESDAPFPEYDSD